MARNTGPGGNASGNPLLQQIASRIEGFQGAIGSSLNDFDSWRERFVPIPEPRVSGGDLIGGLSRPGDPVHTQQYREEVQEHQQQAEQQEALRERLRRLARKFYGRDPSFTELNQFWQEGVNEAEAADSLGMLDDPTDTRSRDDIIEDSIFSSLERLAESEERPGAEAGPTTRTSTSTSVSLTDPETAEGIIQSALRNALGRRATDDEISAFTATLNSLERENATVSTTTTTTDPTGDSTSETVTEGGSPSGEAVARTWLDRELNAEIDVHRAGTEYFQAAQALAGGIT